MTGASTVSVFIPCYNYGRFLPDCVASVLSQSGVDLRVLIVDDASTDDSAAVAARLAALDDRVELRIHRENRGHIAAYNEGMAWATGTYTVLIDPDDMLTPGSLQRACALMDAHPEVGLVYGDVRVFHDGAPVPPPSDEHASWTIWPGQEWVADRCRAASNCIYAPEAVVRTGLYHQLGGYREELPHTADFEMWMRLALHADVGYIAGPHQAVYRQHPASLHNQRFNTERKELPQYVAAFATLFREYADRIADAERLETLVRRTLAERALNAACRLYDHGPWHPDDAIAFEQLALATYPRAATLAVMSRLQRRKLLGPRLWPLVHPIWMAARRAASLRR
jgi:glycosyltransferase involved in cell wall biosynthesis